MKKIKYWWEETKQCPDCNEDHPIMEFDDNATDDEIEKAIRQSVMNNFEWGYYEEVSK